MFNKAIYFLKNCMISPLSLLWRKTHQFRRVAHDLEILSSFRPEIPTISIGNLSFGGTGKTPFTLWLHDYLNTLGVSPYILTRGHKGKLSNSHGLLFPNPDILASPQLYGDESVMLARNIRSGGIIVGKKRVQNLKFYAPKNRPDFLILEDGHQHLRLKRDLDIVLFNAMVPLSKYHCFPKGLLREGPQAIERSEIIIITHTDKVSKNSLEKLEKYLKKYQPEKSIIVHAQHQAKGLYTTNFHLAKEVHELRGIRAVVASGLAHNQSFFQTLENLGVEIVEKYSLPDHHFYKPSEIEKISKIARVKEAIVIVTEKDIVKMKRMVDNSNFYYLAIHIQLLKGEELLKAKIKEKFPSTF